METWNQILKTRTMPKNGVQVPQPYFNMPPTPKLNHLATWHQKKKAHGAFFKALEERYGSHSDAITALLRHVSLMTSAAISGELIWRCTANLEGRNCRTLSESEG